MEIEQNVPIVKLNRYPFASMEIGDSVFFEDFAAAERMSNAGYSYGRTHEGFRLSRRKVEGGYRVWRVA